MNKELNMMNMMMMITIMMMMTKMMALIKMLQKPYFQLQAVRKLELLGIQEYGYASYIHNTLLLM
jgi:hypothetical protein